MRILKPPPSPFLPLSGAQSLVGGRPAATDWADFPGRCSHSCSWWSFSCPPGLGQTNKCPPGGPQHQEVGKDSAAHTGAQSHPPPQLRSRVTRNRAVRPVALPQTQDSLSPGTPCTVAGWGLLGLNRGTDVLQDVQLTVQRNGECSRRFMFYTGQTQICVGDPRERKSAFLVERILDDGGGRRELWKSPRPAPPLCDIYLEPQSTAQVRTQSPGNSQGRPISPLSLSLPVSTSKAALCLQWPCQKRFYRPHRAHLQRTIPFMTIPEATSTASHSSAPSPDK
ncbi:uncharacterized protein LOC116749160 isoform X2 [Phocoena sinus]|uniref:uncharacterized protein LOC116749160 isoform X2 n=1 Tax=Phocoena sinus TaxID=42100 RepID=UPI0013C3FC9C|nr:uncharacterized protein LOC116749160 isoform X2 [Phocoena sinus]